MGVGTDFATSCINNIMDFFYKLNLSVFCCLFFYFCFCCPGLAKPRKNNITGEMLATWWELQLLFGLPESRFLG